MLWYVKSEVCELSSRISIILTPVFWGKCLLSCNISNHKLHYQPSISHGPSQKLFMHLWLIIITRWVFILRTNPPGERVFCQWGLADQFALANFYFKTLLSNKVTLLLFILILISLPIVLLLLLLFYYCCYYYYCYCTAANATTTTTSVTTAIELLLMLLLPPQLLILLLLLLYRC